MPDDAEEWIDNLDPKDTKKDAERLAAWMRRGGWRTRLAKISGKWHVQTTPDESHKEHRHG